jgi:hypothetical protein
VKKSHPAGCRIALLFGLAGCAGGGPGEIARLAASPDWTPERFDAVSAAPPPRLRATLSKRERREDIAFLQRMLDAAYPPPHRPLYELQTKRAREIADNGATRRQFCERLAAEYRPSSIDFVIGGTVCGGGRRARFRPPSDAKPLHRNYSWRVERDGGGEVGILTITRFAAPDDAGWAEFGAALRQVASADVVAVDVENAPGDDPRMGFALLAALGLQDFARVRLRPLVARDNAFAEVARRNLASRQKTAPRSRTLWSQFDSAGEVARLGRSLAPTARAAELGHATFVEGAGCEAACQMLVALARPQRNVEVVHNVTLDDRLSGDERGLVRLPHSGVEVTFPTVAYSPNEGGNAGTRYSGDGSLVPEAVARLGRLAGARREYAKWSALKPVCASLPPAPAAPRSRGWCEDAKESPATALVGLSLDEASARNFLGSCAASTALILAAPQRGHTIAIATAPTDVLDRIASAPFVTDVECSRPLHLHSR